MSPNASGGRDGPDNALPKAILETDPDAYPDTVSALQAALARCPRYRCQSCGRERYGNAGNCRRCGGAGFSLVNPQPDTRRGCR